MRSQEPYRSWNRSRGNRLSLDAYPAEAPVHVTLGTHEKKAWFTEAPLARAVFEILAQHPQTLASCLMPDHLHWLLKDAAQMVGTVRDFKSYSNRRAWEVGHEGKLWQRSYWDHVIRREESLEEVVGYIVGNPVRAGLVENVEDYPYQIVAW